MKTRLLAGFFVDLGQSHNPMGGYLLYELVILINYFTPRTPQPSLVRKVLK